MCVCVCVCVSHTASLNGLLLFLVDWQYEVQRARNVQQLQQGVRARQQMIYRALKVRTGHDLLTHHIMLG